MGKTEIQAQPALGTQNRKLLVGAPGIGARLGRNGKRGMAVTVVKQGTRQAVNPECRVTVQSRNNPHWLALEHHIARTDSVGTQIVQSAAARIQVVADVARVEKLLCQRAVHGTHLAQATARKDCIDLGPLRVVAKCKPLFNMLAAAISFRTQQSHLIRADA